MKRGDIFWVNLETTVGSEIKKRRPCVLIGATPISSKTDRYCNTLVEFTQRKTTIDCTRYLSWEKSYSRV